MTESLSKWVCHVGCDKCHVFLWSWHIHTHVAQQYVLHTKYTLHQYTAALHTSAVCGSNTHFTRVQQHYTHQQYVVHTAAVYYTIQHNATALHTSAVCTTHFTSMRQHSTLEHAVARKPIQTNTHTKHTHTHKAQSTHSTHTQSTRRVLGRDMPCASSPVPSSR